MTGSGRAEPVPSLEFRPADPLVPPASELLSEMLQEIAGMYPPIGGVVGVPLDPSELAPPGGVYLVGWLDGQAVAGGGLRPLGPGLAEIKRMYVRAYFRGRGLSRPLLEALEQAARGLGADRVRLDTGPKQPGAFHLYTSAGYRSIANYNDNRRASFWGEKELA